MRPKPGRIFDRDQDWEVLSRWADRAGPQLGVVSGRRRQGKTYLLDALVEATGGFYFGAVEATETESLELLAEALARFTGARFIPSFRNWHEAVAHLFDVGESTRKPFVIDEFPYLSAASPSLPSILQRDIDQAVLRDRPISLLLCGSAMSVMGKLLGGRAPLRGRANLELVVRPFDYRLAARYWGITDPRLAVLVHSVVGGTPAYRSFLSKDGPSGIADFEEWVLRTVLDRTTPLFREARTLLEEGPEAKDNAIYHSLLAAIARGRGSRGGIAAYVGRKSTDIGHQLNVLEDTGLLRREPDVFRSNRSVYRITEPVLTFYQAVMRPRWSELEAGHARQVWTDAAPHFASQVVGPAFEDICRSFVRLASPELFGGLPGEVGAGVVADPARRTGIEIDVVTFAPRDPGTKSKILSLGEAKWGKRLGPRHLDRLRRARDLLARQGYDTKDTVLALYSGKGFEADLPQDERVMTVGLPELYQQ